MFGFTIISDKRLRELERHESAGHRLNSVWRWFSGWKDLDIIWNFVFDEKQFDISRVRDAYADARKTDAHGKPLEKK